MTLILYESVCADRHIHVLVYHPYKDCWSFDCFQLANYNNPVLPDYYQELVHVSNIHTTLEI